MKKILQILPLTLVLAWGDKAQAQLSFGADFESYSNTNILSFDFNPPWSSNDSYGSNGVESGYAVSAPGSTGSKVGFLGGYLSGSPVVGPSVPLPASLNFGFNAGGENQFQFNWIQNLANPSADDNKRDVFGWAVRDLNGQVILSLKFRPVDVTRDGVDYDTAVYGYSGAFWAGGGQETSDQFAGLFNRGEWTAFSIALDTLTDTWSATINNIAGTTPYTFVTSASPNAVNTAYGLGALSAIWNPGDLQGNPSRYDAEAGLVTSAGANTLFFDNISVTAIPEPSSTALLGCGLALWFGTRRRSKTS